MVRMLIVAAAFSGCFLDPTCKDTCDGDRIASCKWKCSGKGKIDIPDCERIYGGTDCSERTGGSGRPMSCRMTTIVTSNSAPESSPSCVDLGSPCDPEQRAICTGEFTTAACLRVEDAGFLQPQTATVCDQRPGEVCHDRPGGVMCVPVPLRSCDPALFPACVADGGFETCQGTPGAGYVILPDHCGQRPCADAGACGVMQCAGDAGAVSCQ